MERRRFWLVEPLLSIRGKVGTIEGGSHKVLQLFFCLGPDNLVSKSNGRTKSVFEFGAINSARATEHNANNVSNLHK